MEWNCHLAHQNPLKRLKISSKYTTAVTNETVELHLHHDCLETAKTNIFQKCVFIASLKNLWKAYHFG